jgi:hypothetical protein
MAAIPNGRERSHSMFSTGRSVDIEDALSSALPNISSLEATTETESMSATRVCPPSSVARVSTTSGVLSCAAPSAPAVDGAASAAASDDPSATFSNRGSVVDHVPDVPIRLSIQSFRENASQGRAFVVRATAYI